MLMTTAVPARPRATSRTRSPEPPRAAEKTSQSATAMVTSAPSDTAATHGTSPSTLPRASSSAICRGE